MIYPNNFEQKIGFDEIRTLLKGRCLSSLGTEWVEKKLHFMTNYDEVEKALNEAREYILFDNENEAEIDNDFVDIREALFRIRPERTFLEETELFGLKRSLQSVIQYHKAFTKKEESNVHTDGEDEVEEENAHCIYPTLYSMASDVETFPQIVEHIDKTLNKYGKIKDTASPKLLTLRHEIEVSVRSISHSFRSIINDAKKAGYINRDVAPTLRDGRLVIPTPSSLRKKIKGIVHDESATGKTIFIEPSVVVEANNHIRELRAEERREIMRILQELSSEIRPHISPILHSLHFLGHIDYLRALKHFSDECHSVIPRVDKNPKIKWIQARHPLLEQSLIRHESRIVPLDISLQQNQHILLISGPNAGGKSVCLKTAGLLQYMLQCGIPVPVDESSEAGIFKDIFIDIGDEQSIENDLSTYSSHLINLKIMMRQAGVRSLLLIDEFGGGTEPQIGGALAEAILNRFVKNSTWGIVTTHYQNLKLFASRTESIVNGAMLYDRSKMQPLFVLQIGNPGSSFAIEMARKIGIPEDVIEYAIEQVGKDYILSDKYLQDIVRDKLYWERKRQDIHQKEKKLESDILQYEDEFSELQQQRKSILRKAKEEAINILDESNAKIESTIRLIREVQAEKEKTKRARAELSQFKEKIEKDADAPLKNKLDKIKHKQKKKQDKKITSTTLQERTSWKETQRQGNFEKGQYVQIIGQTSVGRIENVGKKSAKVLFGMMFTQVPLNKLQLCDPPKNESKTDKVSTFVSKETRDAMYEKKLHFSPKIDIRGMHVNEALTAISYFIDDAIQLEQSRVSILHGTGTGTLRNMVRNYLKTIPNVANFHDEHVQLGGVGITIVEFK